MSSGFISESEIVEARRRRQEEWEKVRTDDQPKEAPEEVYDTRPLFQRLEEQRMKKEAEYEEAHKLKNMIRGLDDDEVGFLDLVEQSKAKAAQMITLEEQKEMREFRERVSNLAESEEMNRLRAQLAPARTPQNSTQSSQKNKLQGVVVRKRKASEMEETKQDKGAPAAKINGLSEPALATVTPPLSTVMPPVATVSPPVATVTPAVATVALQCLGVLPGLGHYDTDSTSESGDSGDDSSDTESDKCCKRDLTGRLEQMDKRKEEAKS